MKIFKAEDIKLKNGKLVIIDKKSKANDAITKPKTQVAPGTSNEFDYKKAGIPVKNGVLTVPEKYTRIAFRGIRGIADLVELNILGKIEFLGDFDIENNPNLKRVNFKHPVARNFADYSNCYSLESITIAGKTMPFKSSSSGIGGFVRGTYEQYPYTIYKIKGPQIMDDISGLNLVFAGTVIDGFEYTGVAFPNSGIISEKEAKEMAIGSVRHHIKKHIAPQLYFNDRFCGDDHQAELLNNVTSRLLQSAKPGTGDLRFNQSLKDGNVPAGKPHDVGESILNQLRAEHNARAVWASQNYGMGM